MYNQHHSLYVTMKFCFFVFHYFWSVFLIEFYLLYCHTTLNNGRVNCKKDVRYLLLLLRRMLYLYLQMNIVAFVLLLILIY